MLDSRDSRDDLNLISNITFLWDYVQVMDFVHSPTTQMERYCRDRLPLPIQWRPSVHLIDTKTVKQQSRVFPWSDIFRDGEPSRDSRLLRRYSHDFTFFFSGMKKWFLLEFSESSKFTERAGGHQLCLVKWSILTCKNNPDFETPPISNPFSIFNDIIVWRGYNPTVENGLPSPLCIVRCSVSSVCQRNPQSGRELH